MNNSDRAPLGLRVRDLPQPRPPWQQTDVYGEVRMIPVRQPLMYCRECQAEYGSDGRLYKVADPERILTCCQRPLVLCEKTIVYVELAWERQ